MTAAVPYVSRRPAPMPAADSMNTWETTDLAR
jgi:hypothetical protein